MRMLSVKSQVLAIKLRNFWELVSPVIRGLGYVSGSFKSLRNICAVGI